MTRLPPRELAILALLAILPALALAPAWWEGRLLGPGDAAALHFPLRAQVWEAWRRGELPSWNPAIFSGAPLLAGYRPGALFPAMPALALLPSSFAAFQVLVLASLCATAGLCFLYLRRLGANITGAYVAGLCFSLGPYLVGHLDDTPTLVAAPTLPLLLLAAESHMNRASAGRAAGVSLALALLLLAGSPEAVRAGGALLAGRLFVGHLLPQTGRGPSRRNTLLSLLAGVALAAPQLLPALIAVREAGPPVSGLAGSTPTLPGATGLVLRYVSHTPAGPLALAALPLMLTELPIRVLAVALSLCLALQWGRGPLSAPGALALVFDFTLAVLAGLSLSAQWRARREALGRRLRAYFLFATLASAAALSVAAATLGPLPETLAGAVGVLALSLILYFSLAAHPDSVRAGVWLLPLTVSFLLQPHGRGLLAEAPTRTQLSPGTVTRQAVDRAMGPRLRQRGLTLAREYPRAAAFDLAYGNLGALAGRRNANGYEPLAPLRSLQVWDGMSAGGELPGSFLRTGPARLELLGVRWAQVPVAALRARPDRWGLGETLDVPLPFGHDRFFPLPITLATEIRIASSMSDALDVGQGDAVAEVAVRLATGRELPLYLRAGETTGEWAYDRPDVKGRVRHRRPRILESFPGPDGSFEGHRYLGRLHLPGRYLIDGVRIERLAGPGRLALSRLGAHDAQTGRFVAASLVSGYVSDTGHFREAAATPDVRLFELAGAVGHAHVAERLQELPAAAVLRALRAPPEAGLDPRRDAVAVASEVRGLTLPEHALASRAEVVRAEGASLDLRAAGPGLLVVAESWDPGWTASLDDRPSPVVRVNHAQLGLVLPPGMHRVALRHRPRGFREGLAFSSLAAVGLLLALLLRPLRS